MYSSDISNNQIMSYFIIFCVGNDDVLFSRTCLQCWQAVCPLGYGLSADCLRHSLACSRSKYSYSLLVQPPAQRIWSHITSLLLEFDFPWRQTLTVIASQLGNGTSIVKYIPGSSGELLMVNGCHSVEVMAGILT